MNVTDLVGFLNARYDEYGQVFAHDLGCDRLQTYDHDIRYGDCDCPWPARVLADVAAKRQVADLHNPDRIVTVFGEDQTPWTLPTWTPSDGDPDEGEYARCPVCQQPVEYDSHSIYPCRTLRLLASPFADHSDFQPHWAP